MQHIDISHPGAAANSSHLRRIGGPGRRRRIIGIMDENGERLTTPQTAERMAHAASAFLGALTGEQRKQACYGFGDERRSWSYLPARDRDGLPAGALDAGPRKLGHELIVTGTSMPAYAKVVSVIAMEHVLRAMAPESLEGLFDPDRYCFKVFGSPGEAAWGWQFAGHHVSLNFTVVDGRYVSPTPCMLVPVTISSWPSLRGPASSAPAGSPSRSRAGRYDQERRSSPNP